MWEDDTPHARFWRQLTTNRAKQFMQNHEFLRTLRRDYDRAKQLQRLFGHVWAEYGTDIFRLTAEACGENWDFDSPESWRPGGLPPSPRQSRRLSSARGDCSQDEEKNAFARAAAKKEVAVKQRADDNVVATREAGSRRGQHQLQGVAQESERVLEEEEGLSGGGQRQSPQKERAKTRQEEQGNCRRGSSFYRRAGGST